MSLKELAHRLNGTLNGDWINIRGPGHSANDRSLGIRFDPAAPDGFYVNSFAGDDLAECRAHVRALLQKLNDESTLSYEPKQAHSENPSANSIFAMSLWQHATPPTGTIVETYLRSRRCWTEPAAADVIRFHPNCPFGSGVSVPAMVALITDAVTGEPIGVHRTALKDNGSDKRFGKDSRKMLGVATRGSVRLHATSEQLAIAEGIETALSASQVFGTAVWATLSKGGIAWFPLLKGLKRLTVFADHDDPGMTAARKCCQRYRAAGISAEVRYPTNTNSDWNDFVMGE
jgi:putative DNA primase/helicase